MSETAQKFLADQANIIGGSPPPAIAEIETAPRNGGEIRPQNATRLAIPRRPTIVSPEVPDAGATTAQRSTPSPSTQFRPAFCTIDQWVQLSGMGRRSVYDALDRGHLKAKKHGSRTLIDVEHGLLWMRSLPDYGDNRCRIPRRTKAVK